MFRIKQHFYSHWNQDREFCPQTTPLPSPRNPHLHQVTVCWVLCEISMFSILVSTPFPFNLQVELISFEKIWLPIVQQYRWYQVIYQIGVFISRSSVNVVQIKRTWILAILQVKLQAKFTWCQDCNFSSCDIENPRTFQ